MDRSIYYHYTSVVTCASIFQSRSIWLTDYRFLNDRRELTHAWEQFLDHFTKVERDAMETALHFHGLEHHYCVFSLSRSPEILSQWRAYADDGRGVAIGFYAPALKWAGLELFECIYEQHDTYIASLAGKHQSLVRSAATADTQRPSSIYDWTKKNAKPLEKLILALILLKNPAFREEHEIRGVHSPRRPQVLFRTTPDSLVPYASLPFVKEKSDKYATSLWVAAPEVWIGPQCSANNRIALELLVGSGSGWHKFDCGYV